MNCERCQVLEAEATALRSALNEATADRRFTITATLTVATLSLLPLLIGWGGTRWDLTSTDRFVDFIFYGVFFASTWVVPTLVGTFGFAMPGKTRAKFCQGLIMSAVTLSVWRQAPLLGVEEEFTNWLEQIGHFVAMMLIAYTAAAFAGLSFNAQLETLPRKQLSVWTLLGLTTLAGVTVRLLQVEEDYGVELLTLCLSIFLACGIQGVLCLNWNATRSNLRRWTWLIFSAGIAPISPALHPEAGSQRAEYALFGISVWLAHGGIMVLSLLVLRRRLGVAGREQSPIEPLASRPVAAGNGD